MAITLQCNNITKIYGKHMALSNVTVGFEEGRIVGLLGPNGSGKTTLMKIAAGLLTPKNGEVSVNGIAVGVETKKIVSFLPERTYLPNSMKVQQAVALFADFYQDFDAKKAEDMLADLQISLTAKMIQLSKGNREKVQLILVMSRNADVYLLDEPIGGVDPAARDYILDTILRNFNPKATLIISTHLISDIENILDDVVMIKQGTVVISDTVDNIREREGKSIDALFREVFAC